jgi:hypothetical protein
MGGAVNDKPGTGLLKQVGSNLSARSRDQVSMEGTMPGFAMFSALPQRQGEP